MWMNANPKGSPLISIHSIQNPTLSNSHPHPYPLHLFRHPTSVSIMSPMPPSFPFLPQTLHIVAHTKASACSCKPTVPPTPYTRLDSSVGIRDIEPVPSSLPHSVSFPYVLQSGSWMVGPSTDLGRICEGISACFRRGAVFVVKVRWNEVLIVCWGSGRNVLSHYVYAYVSQYSLWLASDFQPCTNVIKLSLRLRNNDTLVIFPTGKARLSVRLQKWTNDKRQERKDIYMFEWPEPTLNQKEAL